LPNLPKLAKIRLFWPILAFLANFGFFDTFWLFWKFLDLEQVAVCHFGGYKKTVMIFSCIIPAQLSSVDMHGWRQTNGPTLTTSKNSDTKHHTTN
jgi:hypothetical protein